MLINTVTLLPNLQIAIAAIPPILKYNSTKPTEDSDCVIAKTTAPVSCELYDAGPPLPAALTLEVVEGNMTSNTSTDWTQDVTTCMWNYPNPVKMNVSEDILDKVRQSSLLIKIINVFSTIIKNIISSLCVLKSPQIVHVILDEYNCYNPCNAEQKRSCILNTKIKVSRTFCKKFTLIYG